MILKQNKYKIILLFILLLFIPFVNCFDVIQTSESNITVQIFDSPQFDSFTVTPDTVSFQNVNLTTYALKFDINDTYYIPSSSGIQNVTLTMNNTVFNLLLDQINNIINYLLFPIDDTPVVHRKPLGFIMSAFN